MIDLAVIIVSWNTAGPLRQCLRAVTEAGEPPREVIVVDNASADGSAEMVGEEFPGVRLVRNSSNAGFSRANNQGLALSTAGFVLLLNSDTVAPPDALPRLVRLMAADPGIGVCGPRLVRPDGTPQPFAFGSDPTVPYLLRRALSALALRRPLHGWSVDEARDVDWVSGACLMTRREVIERMGGLDERIFMYFEDNDFCLRVRRAGWRVRLFPEVQVTHLGGQSLAGNPAARREYARSLVYFHRKHYGRLSSWLVTAMLPAYRRLNEPRPEAAHPQNANRT